MQIGVVVPIVKYDYVFGLLDSIDRNTKKPYKVLIIDNSMKQKLFPQSKNVLVYNPPKQLGVNESWNFGIKYFIKEDTPFISVLNDDLLLEKFFFEKLLRLLKKNPGGAVFCPETVSHPKILEQPSPLGTEYCLGMRRREGWAFTVRSGWLKVIESIPSELVTFCGDDWLWHQAYRTGMSWYKMFNIWCYHYVGGSMDTKDGMLRAGLRQEKEALKKLL